MTRITMLLLPALLCPACLALSQEPGPSYEHLKFLDPLAGNWKVVTTEGDRVISDGQEESKWILNKSCMRHTGWGQFDGKPVQYMFVTGWNPKTQKVFQWSIGATDDTYGISKRSGFFDPDAKVWTSRSELVLSDGEIRNSNVAIKFVDENTITIEFSKRRLGESNLPDQHDRFTRAPKAETPALNNQPGPGYEHLKFLDFSVGRWKLAALMANGRYEGEEVNEWVFDKNFMHTTGWGTFPDGTRWDYELLAGWDPVKKKIVMMAIASDGWHGTREGTYDAEKNCLGTRQAAVDGKGIESSSTVEEQYIDNNRFVLKFSDGIKAGVAQPNFEVNVTRIPR